MSICVKSVYSLPSNRRFFTLLQAKHFEFNTIQMYCLSFGVKLTNVPPPPERTKVQDKGNPAPLCLIFFLPYHQQDKSCPHNLYYNKNLTYFSPFSSPENTLPQN